jgi:hypothetical protein
LFPANNIEIAGREKSMQKSVYSKDTPLNMPGPQFSQKKGVNWWQRNYKKIIPSLIIVLIAISAYYFYQSYSVRQDLLKPTIEEINQANLTQKESASPTVKPASTTNQNLIQTTTPEIQKNETSITAIAANGNGKTHLARQAVKEYLKDKPELKDKLQAEHLIFIEDYLQKQVAGASTLNIGDQITFSDNDLQTAINKALGLSDTQLKNLNKYVPLVPSLLNG